MCAVSTLPDIWPLSQFKADHPKYLVKIYSATFLMTHSKQTNDYDILIYYHFNGDQNPIKHWKTVMALSLSHKVV